jgi:hypothetical protein
MGSFEEWSEIVGSILAYAGVEGFLGNLKEMREQATDGVTDQWGAFVEELETFFGGKIFTASDILKVVREVDKYDAHPTEEEKAFREAIPDGILDRKDGNPNRILGNGLQRFKGKIFDTSGRHLVYSGKAPRSGVAQWKVERREVVKSEASPQITQIMQVSETPQEFFSTTTALPRLPVGSTPQAPSTIEEDTKEKKLTQGYTNLRNLCNLHGDPSSLDGRGEERQGQPDDDDQGWAELMSNPEALAAYMGEHTPAPDDDYDPFLDL